MTGPFLITGLPRSRTAWFAVACSTATTSCYHEPERGWPSLREAWVPGIGISDSGLGLHLAEIMETVAPRTLIIERPKAEVLASLRRYLGAAGAVGNSEDWAAVETRLDALTFTLGLVHPAVRRVAYADLQSKRVVGECLDWLGVCQPHLSQLMRLNVQSDLGFNLERAARANAETAADPRGDRCPALV